MIKIKYDKINKANTTFLKDIPTGTVFTGSISGYPNNLFMKLGPNVNVSETYGGSGCILALDSDPKRLTLAHMWDVPLCPVKNYQPVDIEIVVKGPVS